MKKYTVIPKLVAIAAMMFAAACADLGTQPDQLLESGAASLAKGGVKGPSAKEPKKEKKGAKVRGKNKRGEERDYTAAARKGGPSGQVASARIDERGGVLSLGEHTLYVPAGAVSRPTRFSMKEANHIVDGVAVVALDMHASHGAGAHTQDVGGGGFAVPVTLCVGYADVDGEVSIDDQADLIWFRGQGQVLEAVDAVQNDSGQFCGQLDHFSLWGIGWP